MREPTALVTKFFRYADTIWIGTMNHMRKSDFKDTELPWYYEQVAINSYENMSRVYSELKDNPKVRWKDSVQKLLGVEQG